VQLLLEQGAELEVKDKGGQMPLSWAAANGHEAVVKLLLEEGAELQSKSSSGRTPLSWAAGFNEFVVSLRNPWDVWRDFQRRPDTAGLES
jgi:ankyrin repeat protein